MRHCDVKCAAASAVGAVFASVDELFRSEIRVLTHTGTCALKRASRALLCLQARKDEDVPCTWQQPKRTQDVRARALVVTAFGPVATSALRALCVAIPPGGSVSVISETRVAAPPGVRDATMPPSSTRGALASPSRREDDARSATASPGPGDATAFPADGANMCAIDAGPSRPPSGSGGAGAGSSDGGAGGGGVDADACTFQWVRGHPASAAVLAAARAAEADTVMVAGIDDWDDEEADVQARPRLAAFAPLPCHDATTSCRIERTPIRRCIAGAGSVPSNRLPARASSPRLNC